MINADSEINIILIEEMPAYFLGQKDLDEVIKIEHRKFWMNAGDVAYEFVWSG